MLLKMKKHTDKIKELEGKLETLVRDNLQKPCPDSSPLFILPFLGKINKDATRQWKLTLRRGRWHLLPCKEDIDYILASIKATDEQREWLWDNLPLKKKKKDFTWKQSPWELIDKVIKCLDNTITKRWEKVMNEGWTKYDYDISEIQEVEEYQIQHNLLEVKLSEEERAAWEAYFTDHHVLDLKLGMEHKIMTLYSDIERLRKDDMTLREFIDYTTYGLKDTKSSNVTKTIYQVVGGKKSTSSNVDKKEKHPTDMPHRQIIKNIYDRNPT
jgi:hypothetical protein